MKIIKILIVMLVGYFAFNWIMSSNKKDNRVFLHDKCKLAIKQRMENINPDTKGCVLCEDRWAKFSQKQCEKLLKNWERARGSKFNGNELEIQELIPILNNYLKIE